MMIMMIDFPDYTINDKVLDGIILLEPHKCPECSSDMEYHSMVNIGDDRIRRWWHKPDSCARMWDHAN
jgi:hypothetical protein